MNASLDFMVTIATAHVHQIVVLLCVIRSQVTATEDVLMVFTVTSAHKSALKIVKTLVIEIRVIAAPAKWDFMEKNAQMSAMKIARMVVIEWLLHVLMDATVASMAHIAICPVQQIANQVHVTTLQVTA